jgi:hypothetical protein
MLMIALPSKVFQLVALQKFRQLRDIQRDPSRLIALSAAPMPDVRRGAVSFLKIGDVRRDPLLLGKL